MNRAPGQPGDILANHAPVQPGDVLADKYRVDRVLGAGGMGVVVAATHLELLEPRALKFMIPSALADAEAAPRFLREARAAAKLKSEHIAKVYDVGRLQNGAPYMVMEYLEGSDLDALLKAHGPLPVQTAALYVLHVCAALAEAHAAGIIHRDLKPANLFVTTCTDGSPCVKVLDFGISKNTKQGSELDVTKTQQVLGSPLYMSPEQMRSSRSIDIRSDIWSVGIVLYKLVTGKVPFTAQSITELVAMVLEASPVPPSMVNSALPSRLDALILRCLRRNRDERYANVVELASALASFAPPGATVSVEAMTRVFAAATKDQRSAAPSGVVDVFPTHPLASATATPLSPALPPSPLNAASSPTFSVSPVLPVPPLGQVTPAGAAQAATQTAPPGEPTSASWGHTRPRVLSRSILPLPLLIVVALSLLAATAGIVLLVRSPASPQTREPAATTLATAGAPVVPTPPSALPHEEQTQPSVTPEPTAALPAAAPPSTGGAPAQATAAPAPKDTAAPKAEAPSKTPKDAQTAKVKSAPEGSAKPGKTILNAPPLF